MRIFRGMVRLCVGFGLLLLAASYLGALHPLGDSLAVFRPWIAYGVAGLGMLAVLARVWRMGGMAVVAAIASVLHIFSFQQLATPTPILAPDMVIYTKNLAAGRADWDALARDITRSGADIVVLQEVTQERMADFATLLSDYPYQHFCNFSERRAMAVASRWPLSDGGCTPQRSLAHAVVDTPSGPVWVASIHQVWPYPYDQAPLLADILAAIPPSPVRQVIAGDFNMVPWGHSVAAIMEAGGTQRISPALPTIEVRGVGLAIDHVLTNGQGTAARTARMGSDHYGMVARIVWEDPGTS